MNLLLTDQQTALQRTVFDFAQDAVQRSTSATFDRQIWRELCRDGWPSVCLPEALGGGGLGLTELALVVESLARAGLITPIFSAMVESATVLSESDNPAAPSVVQQLSAGNLLAAVAYVERESEPNPTSMDTSVQQVGPELVLNGRKRFVRDAGDADEIIVFGASDVADAPAAVLVPWSAAGLQRRHQSVSGGESQFELEFPGISLPATAVIADGNRAAGMLFRLGLRGAALKAAELVGLGQSALDLSVNYATTRVQFARPIGSFQAVQHHAADMYREIQLARLLAYQAVAALDDLLADGSADAERLAAASRAVHFAKAKASEAIPAVLRLAHQIHGGVGYYRDYPLERITRWAMASQAAYGNAAYHRRALAIQLQGHQV